MKDKLPLLSNFKRYTIFVVIFFVMIASARSKETPFIIQGGVGPGITQLKTIADNDKITPQIILTSRVLYQFSEMAIGFGAFAQYGTMRRVKFKVYEGTVAGDGTYKNSSFGPRIHLYPNFIQNQTNKRLSFSIGYLVGIQTFKIKKSMEVQSPSFNTQHKITYEGYGFHLGVHYEEINSQINHPYFMEINFKHLRSTKQSVVGGTKFAVETIHEDRQHSPIKENTLMFILGLKFL